MRRKLNILVLALAGAAGFIGLAFGLATANRPVCAGSIVGLCYVCARIAPLLFRSTLGGPDVGGPRRSLREGTEAFQLGAPSPADGDDRLAAAVRMIETDRYAFLTRPQLHRNLSDALRAESLAVLRSAMALVPTGSVRVGPGGREAEDDPALSASRVVQVAAFYLDRHCVTNRQYQAFVAAGGYSEVGLWEPDVWPSVSDFVDRSGHPGPRLWNRGALPAGENDHPVVGVCWFEAQAYARWVGKRLPTDSEWVKAASWPVAVGDGFAGQRKYPWGNAMERRRANLWGSGPGRTLPVTALPEGTSVGDVFQLCGNVWEWTADAFGTWRPAPDRIRSSLPLKAIRGGAYDTYFETHASNDFQSGENPLSRQANIGFRCALSRCDVAEDQPGADDPRDEHVGCPQVEPVRAPANAVTAEPLEEELAVVACGEAPS